MYICSYIDTDIRCYMLCLSYDTNTIAIANTINNESYMGEKFRGLLDFIIM